LRYPGILFQPDAFGIIYYQDKLAFTFKAGIPDPVLGKTAYAQQRGARKCQGN
jgi:hypothetical protein